MEKCLKQTILLRIASRMLYLSRLKHVAKDITDAKLTELARLSDWIEGMNG